MNAPPVIETLDLAAGYRLRRKRRPVLTGLNLAVRPGEFVSVLGPNGIGKSTLLRTIAGIQKPLAGHVRIGGRDSAEFSPIEIARRIGVVLTERVAVGAFLGRQIVELGRYPHIGWMGRLSPHDRDVVDWAMRAAGAAHLALRDTNKLSDGERQRLMVARAMAQEPAILILDEPTAYLDVAARIELMALLRSLAHEGNLAIVVSTHELELALRMSDTAWLIMPNGVFHTGAPEDLVAAGFVDRAFPSESVRFQPEECVFRPVGRRKFGRAIVQGSGLGAALTSAVLEREGFEVVENGPALFTVDVSSEGGHWTVQSGAQSCSGETFAALAAAVRTINL